MKWTDQFTTKGKVPSLKTAYDSGKQTRVIRSGFLFCMAAVLLLAMIVGPVSAGYTTVSSVGPITGSSYLNSTLRCPVYYTYNTGGSPGSSLSISWYYNGTAGSGTYSIITTHTPSVSYSDPSPYTDTYTVTNSAYVGGYIACGAIGTQGSRHNSTVFGPVKANVTAIANISGTAQVGETLTAGAVTPAGATVTYQWQNADSASGPWDNLSATASTYVVESTDLGKYMRVAAAGTGNYTRVAYSNAVGPVTEEITAIGDISGITEVGQTLTAGEVTPSGSDYSLQWQNASSGSGPFADISGATGSTYNLGSDDVGTYIRVNATGTGNYVGTVTSDVVGPVTEYAVTSTVGIYRDGVFYLKNDNSGGPADNTFAYGDPADIPLVGDWTGKGYDSVGIYRGNVFYLKNDNSGGPADNTFAYGDSGDTPIVWNHDGYDSVGIYRGNVFYLKNDNSGGPADNTFAYGDSGDTPLMGDWTGKGYDSVGVYRGNVFYLKNDNSGGPADNTFAYGEAGDIPVVWNHDGYDSIGVYRDGVFYLKNDNSGGVADYTFAYGVASDTPVMGYWSNP